MVWGWLDIRLDDMNDTTESESCFKFQLKGTCFN